MVIAMLVGSPLPFIEEYVNQLSVRMERHQTSAVLTAGRRAWLSFCLTCIIVTESLCWRKFVRASLGYYSEALLSWYFRQPLTWELLLLISVELVLETFQIQEGLLLIDDTGKKRSKVTHQIPYVHYFKDKEGTGHQRGQEIVLLVFVSPLITLPVAFEFYQPDPTYTAWARLSKRQTANGVPSCQRSSKPAFNPAYPTKSQLALRLLTRFTNDYPWVKVKAVLADALYGNADFMQTATQLFANLQVISQLRQNQKISYRGRTWHLDEYFKAYPGVSKFIQVRGLEKPTEVIVGSARLYVEAHQSKRFVVAIRFPNELNYRYLVASDLSWRTLDIVQAYTYRWLVEVTIADLKSHEGWGHATKQPGVEGSRRGLTLSLLCDHCLLLHPEQRARVAQQQPLCTIGSLQRHLQLESLTLWLSSWLESSEFTAKMEQFSQAIQPLFPLQPSHKHLHGRTLPRLEPTPSLKYRSREVLATV
jgi:hypothetical protein